MKTGLSFLTVLLVAELGSIAAAESQTTSEEQVRTVVEKLEPAGIAHQQGHGYLATLRLGRQGDKGGRSNCVLLEDGMPLPMPHASLADVRSKGAGRYAHWNVEDVLFSASDNSDPRTNGRAYALVSRQRVAARSHVQTSSAAKLPPRFANGRLVRRLGVAGSSDAVETRIEWPYVMLGGEVSLTLSRANEPVEITLSAPGEAATALKTAVQGTTAVADLQEWFSSQKKAVYSCQLRLRSRDGKPLSQAVRDATLLVRFQFAPLTLPQVQPGGSAFSLRLVAPGGGSDVPADLAGFEVRHEWEVTKEDLPQP